MARLLLLFMFFPAFITNGAMASNIGTASIDYYVPPPMFGEGSVVRLDAYPPLPPRRPDKINAPQSYIDYMRKHGEAPKLIKRVPVRTAPEISEDNLVQPSAQDILDQINPQ